jgi:adenylate kinase
MIIAITGTPGTGKSTVSTQLRAEGYEVIPLNETAIENKLLLSYDDKRQTHEVDIDSLNQYLINLLNKNITANQDKTRFLEGHISHLLDIIDQVIILRCHPDELRKRLTNKGWSDEKIQENLEAEAVDAITLECVEKFGNKRVFELDTTKTTTKRIVKSIKDILNDKVNEYTPGKIDWSEEILKWY